MAIRERVRDTTMHLDEQGSVHERKGTGRRSAVGLVYDYLRQKILEGEYPPGMWLRQDAIAADLGLSRMPVREALRQAEAEGWVVSYRNRGWAVSALTAEDVEELYVMRMALEGLAARVGAVLLKDEDMQRMEELLRRMEELRVVQDGMLFLRPDWEFHDVLYASARRPRLYRRIKSLQENAARYIGVYITLPGATDLAIEGHQRILQACKSRDPQAVEETARQHIAEIAQRVIEFVREHPSGRFGEPVQEA